MSATSWRWSSRVVGLAAAMAATGGCVGHTWVDPCIEAGVRAGLDAAADTAPVVARDAAPRPDVCPALVDAAAPPPERCEVPRTECDPEATVVTALPAAPPCARRPYDVLIVLGSPANADGTPSETNLGRVALALRARDLGLGDRFITTGGAVHNAWVEAEVLRDALVARGVSPDAVVLERAAQHTDENLDYSTEIMAARGWRTALVVSQLGHLYYTAECDSTCCVRRGRATLLDFGPPAAPLRLMRYELFPGAAPFEPYECPALMRRGQCPELANRLRCG